MKKTIAILSPLILLLLAGPAAAEKTAAEEAAEFKDYVPYSTDGEDESVSAGGQTVDESFFSDGLTDGQKETQSNFEDTEDTYGDDEEITEHGQATRDRLLSTNPDTAQARGLSIVTDSMSSPDGALNVKTELCRAKRNTEKITIDDSVFPPMVSQDHIDITCDGLESDNLSPCPQGTEYQREAERCYAEPDISCPDGGSFDAATGKCLTDAELISTEVVRVPNEDFAEGDNPPDDTLIGNGASSGWGTRMTHKTCRQQGYAIAVETDAYNDYGSTNNFVSHGTEIGGFDDGVSSFLKNTPYTDIKCGEASCPADYFLPDRGAEMQCHAEPSYSCPDGTALTPDKEACGQDRVIEKMDGCRVDPTHPDYWKCHDARTHFEMWKNDTGVSVTIDDVEDHFQRLHLADNSWENGKICFEASLSAICQEDVQASWAIQGGCEIDVVAEQECPPGSVFSEGEGCVGQPDESYECPEGLEYNELTGECSGEGELYRSCPDGYSSGAVLYDTEIAGCFREADKSVSCPDDTAYTAPDKLGTGYCGAEVEFTPVCPEGTTYDGDGSCTAPIEYIPNCESDEEYSGHYNGLGECYKEPATEKYCWDDEAEKEGDLCVKDLEERDRSFGWIAASDSCSNIGKDWYKANTCSDQVQDYAEDYYPVVEPWESGDFEVTKSCSGSNLSYFAENNGYSKDTRFSCEFQIEDCDYGYEYVNGQCEDDVSTRPDCPWNGYSLRDGWETLPDDSSEYFSEAECASDPDYTLECPEGTEIEGSECVTEAEYDPVCPAGTEYNSEAGPGEPACQGEPDYTISCPEGSERVTDNAVPSPGNDYCETQNFDSRFVCADGTELTDPEQSCPVHEPEFIQECPKGLEVSEDGRCIGQPELSAECPDGMTFDEQESKCVANSEEDCLDPVTHQDPAAVAGEMFGDCEPVTEQDSVTRNPGRSEHEESCYADIDPSWEGCSTSRSVELEATCEDGVLSGGDCVMEEPPVTPECPDGMTYQVEAGDSGEGQCVSEPETNPTCDEGWSLAEGKQVCEQQSEADSSICPGEAVLLGEPPVCQTTLGVDPVFVMGSMSSMNPDQACSENGFDYGGYTEREHVMSWFGWEWYQYELYCYTGACPDDFQEANGVCEYQPSDAELCDGGSYSDGMCEKDAGEEFVCSEGELENEQCIEAPAYIIDCPDGMTVDGDSCVGEPGHEVSKDEWDWPECKTAMEATREKSERSEDCSITGYQSDWDGESCTEIDGVEVCPGTSLADELSDGSQYLGLATSASFDSGRCESSANSDSCEGISEDCEIANTECAQKDIVSGIGSVCTLEERTYTCPAEEEENSLVNREVLDCEGTMIECGEDTCMTMDGSENEGFGQFVAQAQMAQTMENYMECDDENGGCILFDGEYKGCRETGDALSGGNIEGANDIAERSGSLDWTCCDLEKDPDEQNKLTEDRWYELIGQWGSVMAKELQNNPGETLAYYFGGSVYAGFKMAIDFGVAYYGRCEVEEMELADAREREVAKYVGTSCAVELQDAVKEYEDTYLAHLCIIQKKEYCVWASPLEKMMAVEGRKQIKRDKYAEVISIDPVSMMYQGDDIERIDAETIDCSGLTVDEAITVDWSKIEDEKWMEALEAMEIEPNLDNIKPDGGEITPPTSHGGYQDSPSSGQADGAQQP